MSLYISRFMPQSNKYEVTSGRSVRQPVNPADEISPPLERECSAIPHSNAGNHIQAEAAIRLASRSNIVLLAT